MSGNVASLALWWRPCSAPVEASCGFSRFSMGIGGRGVSTVVFEDGRWPAGESGSTLPGERRDICAWLSEREFSLVLRRAVVFFVRLVEGEVAQ